MKQDRSCLHVCSLPFFKRGEMVASQVSERTALMAAAGRGGVAALD